MKDIPVAPSLHDSLILPPGYIVIHLGCPIILPRLRLTLLKMLGLWGVPYEQPKQAHKPRTTPTYYLGGRVYVRCWFTTPRWGVTRFYQCLRLCSCGTKPQRPKNHHF